MTNGWIKLSLRDAFNKPVAGIRYRYHAVSASGGGVTAADGLIQIDRDLIREMLHLQLMSQITGKYLDQTSIYITSRQFRRDIVLNETKVSTPLAIHDGKTAEGERDLSLPEFKKHGVLTLQQFIEHYGPCLMNDPVHGRDENGHPHVRFMGIGDRIISYPEIGISDVAYKEASKYLVVEENVIKAFYLVEAASHGFLPCGVPKILYERHKVYIHSGKNANPLNNDDNRELSFDDMYLRKGKMTTHAWQQISNSEKYKGNLGSWKRFCMAEKIGFNIEDLIKSVSWGAFQVLGEYYNEQQFIKIIEMANSCFANESAHLKLFVNFCNTKKTSAKGNEREKLGTMRFAI